MSSHKLPLAFQQIMHDKLKDDYLKFSESIQQSPTVSIRKNKDKCHSLGLDMAAFASETPVGWCPDGFYLPTRPSFTFDPIFHCGGYYVQEASSMFVYQFIKNHVPQTPVRVLDLCAAPGGKSTLLLSALPAGSLLFSNEIVRQRSQILKENLIKWGNPNIIVTSNSSGDYLNSGIQFDLVLCDAPCSGEGMFRKDPASILEWSVENISMCSLRQREILANIWPCVKPGGILLYSTCTYNNEEDEGNAQFINEELGGEPLSLETPATWGVDTVNYAGGSVPVYHFFPHKCKGEGFFICGFRKNEESDSAINTSSKKKNRQTKKLELKRRKPVPQAMTEWITDASSFTFEQSEAGDIYAFPKEHSNVLSEADARLHVIHHGIQIANIKGKGFKPSHGLAMSNQLNVNAFNRTEVDEATALSYLRCESQNFPSSPRGFVLLCFKGYPLGFVNNLGNRANNMYPAEWRIRKLSCE